MFGLPMAVTTPGGIVVTMRPTRVEDAAAFSEGFSSYPAVKTLTIRSSMSVEAEAQWIRDHDADKTSCGWVICVGDQVIGNTGFDSINDRRATSGCCIYRRDMWGKGIITAVHHARMYYAVHVLGLEAVDSAVLAGNDASSRALERVGYVTYASMFGMAFTEGKNTHGTRLLWVNPVASRWNSFWDGPVPADHAEKFKAGRERARTALKWAEQGNVIFL